MNCGSHHDKCECGLTYEQALTYFENYIANALLCGKLQGGLHACDSNTVLPAGTPVVTCAQLQDKINELIEKGTIHTPGTTHIPGVKSLDFDGERLTLVDQTGTSFQVKLKGLMDKAVENLQMLADGTLTLTLKDGTVFKIPLQKYLADLVKDASIKLGVLDKDGNLVLSSGNGEAVTVNMDALKKVHVERDGPVIGDGTKENPLDVDFSRVCWKVIESMHFTDKGLVIEIANQCNPVVLPLDEILTVLNNKVKVSVDTGQGIITGTGKEGNGLGIDLRKLAELLAGDSHAWTAIMNATNNALSVSNDPSLKGTGKPTDKLGVQLSPDSGNMLQTRGNGLYYGVEAPVDISTLYVSTSLGDDSNAGTRAAPMRTIEAALDTIRARNAPGTYVINLRAGETFTPSRRVYLISGTWQLTFTYYDDPLFNDIHARDGYYPEADARLKRPTVIFDTYIEDVANNIVGWTGFSVSPTSTVSFRGCKVQFQQTSAGLTTSGEWCWYCREIQFSGCDVTVNSDHQAIGTANNISTSQCNFTMNGKAQFFSAGYGPSWVDFLWVPPGTTNRDPRGQGPDVVGRTVNFRSVVTPANGMALAVYDTATKTLFGWSTNWDIFKHG